MNPVMNADRVIMSITCSSAIIAITIYAICNAMGSEICLLEIGFAKNVGKRLKIEGKDRKN
jgi:hypothetical protein